jgi:hypothetical protein
VLSQLLWLAWQWCNHLGGPPGIQGPSWIQERVSILQSISIFDEASRSAIRVVITSIDPKIPGHIKIEAVNSPPQIEDLSCVSRLVSPQSGRSLGGIVQALRLHVDADDFFARAIIRTPYDRSKEFRIKVASLVSDQHATRI